MFKIRSTTQLAAAVLASGCFALALGARAEAGSYSTGMKATSPACERATLSAWFERQRQLTDGDFVAGEIATPRECSTMQGANAAPETAPGKRAVTAAKAPRQGRPSDYEGVAQGGE